VAALWVIAAISETKMKGLFHHTSTVFPSEEHVRRERTGGKGFSLILLLFGHSLLLIKLTKL